MLRDRGFLISDDTYQLLPYLDGRTGTEEDYRALRDLLTQQLQMFVNSDQTRRAIVTFYRQSGKVPKKALTDYESILSQANTIKHITDGIFISEEVIGPLAKGTADIITDTYNVQFFLDENFSYYPVGHRFTPRHEGLTDEEKITILNEQKISFNKMPQLLANDTIVRWYHWPVGTLVRITRENETSRYYEYRAVVNALM
jgi:DNA-directed RNA polymerase subunit H (RpoH/RPB5)